MTNFQSPLWHAGYLAFFLSLISARLFAAPIEGSDEETPGLSGLIEFAQPDKQPEKQPASGEGSEKPTGNGLQPYQPTREEWISVLFNSSYQIDNMATHGYRIKYACPPGTETVIIQVTHLPDVDRPRMNASINLARKMVGSYARSKGWDGWLKIEERFIQGKPQPKSNVETAPSSQAEDIKDVVKDALRDALSDLMKEKDSSE